MAFSFPLAAKSLYVFIPTEIRANVMQEKMGSFCSGIDITVFGRAKDFHRQVNANPPSAILSLEPVVKYSKAFNTVLTGRKNGFETEGYVLVSIDKQLELASIAGKKIGVVDLLGRKPMAEFITNLFKTKIQLKRVTKVEDLLPLITFGSVDGIFISESIYSQLKLKSNLNLVETKPGIKLGLASAAIDSSNDRDVIQCIAAFDTKLNTILGVDEWRLL